MNAVAAQTGTGSTRRPAWQIVALREIAVKARDKNFLIGLAVTIVMLVGSFALQIWLANKTDTQKVAVVTSQTAPSGAELVASAEKAAKADDAKVDYSTLPQPSVEKARAAVTSGDADAALLKTAKGWQLIGDKKVDTDLQRRLTASAAQLTLASNAKAQGVDLAKLSGGSQVTTQTLSKDADRSGLSKVVTVVFAFLFYFVAFMFGMPIAQSVVEEKQSRIVEILASAVSLRQILAGKILGNATLAIAQTTLLMGVALIGLSQTKWRSMVGTVAGASGWFLLFFLVGFFVVACLFAVAGALASRSEDVQSTAQPVIMLVVGVLVIGLSLDGAAQVVASYVPVVSTVTMPARVMDGSAAWWEPLVAIALALISAYGITRVATRLYTRSIMATGGRLSYREAFRLGR